MHLHAFETGDVGKDAASTVLMKFVSVVARAAVAAVFVLAYLLATAIVSGTFIDILALLTVFRQSIAISARALHFAPRIEVWLAVVCATPIVYSAVVDIVDRAQKRSVKRVVLGNARFRVERRQDVGGIARAAVGAREIDASVIARSRGHDPAFIYVETVLVVESDAETRITETLRRTVPHSAMLLATSVINIAGSVH